VERNVATGALSAVYGTLTAVTAGLAARACPHDAVSTQGHVLATGDFIATLAVEAGIQPRPDTATRRGHARAR
jgi:hypothetical protein